ncbi:DUF5343 domain-containing protein [Sandaracinobacteroides saxicola]|uniref:DUF5343 domain-containing protein n=1 Tax=Sandaracinobacteroides saxicola TaxID=2759707 RepID=A0A7G5IHC8_9SPHN|nr:DUF5343 domain-containing protein [Sandaracinobacteroides saxicola]QMW22770.1 DUF5343 domain-containing protein [Sandaracinobacteroides saxicola]
MADKNRYPQIPSTVWWGVRSILNRTPNATIDERLLGVQLGVQEVAAKAYINELRHVGIVTEEGKATPLAQRWRLDDSYGDAVSELIQATYPEGLVHIAPPGEAERQKVVSWFQRAGLGQGAAGNKAATYLLLSTPTPNEAPRPAAKAGQSDSPARARPPRRQTSGGRTSDAEETRTTSEVGVRREMKTPPPGRSGDTFPLNINVQIHISADAGSEQIESIFQAMRRYLYDVPAT